MIRYFLTSLALLSTALLASAGEPAKKLPPEQRRQWEAKWQEADAAGSAAFNRGNYPAAAKAWKDALDAARVLYARAEYPNGHADLASSLHNLGLIYKSLGNLKDAEPLYREAIAMRRAVFKGDHQELSRTINNLGLLLQAQGKYADAEPLLREALQMRKRLFSTEHTDVAMSLNCLAVLYYDQARYAEAEPLAQDALAMYRRLAKGDSVDLLFAMNNLGAILIAQKKLDDAEPLYRGSLAMARRIVKGDHPFVVNEINNLAYLLRSQGKPAAAEQEFRTALAMAERFFKSDHPSRALCLLNLGVTLGEQGKLSDGETQVRAGLAMRQRLSRGDHTQLASALKSLAEILAQQGKPADAAQALRDSLAMYRRLIRDFAARKSEGETLSLIASFPRTLDQYLSLAAVLKHDPAQVYAEVSASKGLVARVYEDRHLRARAAAANPEAARQLATLASVRRRRGELLLAPRAAAADAAQKRETDLRQLDAQISELNRTLPAMLPPLARTQKLAAATPADIQKALPAGVAVVDFLRYVHFTYDQDDQGRPRVKRSPKYAAFLLTHEALSRVDLDNADDVDAAVASWRKAISAGEDGPHAKVVRDAVWASVRKHLPAGTKTVYVAPDQALCRVPWAAVPGDKTGTILLEDFAVAVVPHTLFLLDKVWPQEPRANPPTGTLVVGGVKYDARPTTPRSSVVASRGDPLVRPGSKAEWAFLPASLGEAHGVSALAGRHRLTVANLDGAAATLPAVVDALPRYRHVHLATHGFFADPAFRSAFDLEEKEYRQASWGERVGRVANNPLLMTGLVLAGANDPGTPSRGVLTGDRLLDLDLSGLELAVLSACETGVGDVAGGEGTFSLQRAFHLAGTRNVVASLWKVPDQSTAALMMLFYSNLWEKKLPPLESLRQAQLQIYRNPGSIPALAKDLRGTFKAVPGTGEEPPRPAADGKTHPRLWAAFTLSGPG